MDDVVRDAVMLGVAAITPLITERTEVTASRRSSAADRVARWQRIAVASAKQCGRAVVPPVHEAVPLADALGQPGARRHASCSSSRRRARPGSLSAAGDAAIRDEAELFVGPEGGWTPARAATGRRVGQYAGHAGQPDAPGGRRADRCDQCPAGGVGRPVTARVRSSECGVRSSCEVRSAKSVRSAKCGVRSAKCRSAECGVQAYDDENQGAVGGCSWCWASADCGRRGRSRRCRIRWRPFRSSATTRRPARSAARCSRASSRSGTACCGPRPAWAWWRRRRSST